MQNQELGPWGREWLQSLIKLRALQGFHPDRGARVGGGIGEDPGQPPGAECGEKDHPLARVLETWGGPTQTHGCPHANHHALGGLEDPGGREDVYGGPPEMEIRQVGRNPVASVGWHKREGTGVQDQER